jgi:hypothetical protein
MELVLWLMFKLEVRLNFVDLIVFFMIFMLLI